MPLVSRGPYLQSATPSSLVVRWRTDVPSGSSVRYGTSASSLDLDANEPVPTTEHAVTLSGLAADTTYYYAIVDAGTVLVGGPAYRFRTPPAQPKPTRIWAIGDAGTASIGFTAPLAVRDAYLSFAGSRPTDVWLMLGDNAYPSGTDEQYQAAVFEVFQDLLRTTPLWPTLGNHETYAAAPDGRIAYTDIFSLPQDGRAGGVPSGSERYYSFNYGNIHFVCLDSETTDKSVGGAMMTWLDQDLAGNTNEWLIAFWHSPPYSKGSHDSDVEGNLVGMRQLAGPILESYGVDLVLCGHSHSYERSFLLNGHYGPSGSLVPAMLLDAGSGQAEDSGAYLKSAGGQGSVYVVAGSSGQTSGGQLNHPAMFVSLNRLGSLVIDVEGNRLEGRFLRENGVVDDHFTVLKGDHAPTILTPPLAQTVVEGDTVTFKVVATGTRPLLYQWLFNGAPLAGATSATLTLNSAQMTQAGRYSVLVSNTVGTVTSTEALLTVIPPPPCAILASGAVAWWPLDGTGADSVGTNNALIETGGTFAAGRVGQGLLLNGTTGFASIADHPSLDFSNALTVELWFRKDQPYVPNVQSVLFDKRDLSGRLNYGASLSVNYGVTLYFGDPAFGGYQSAAYNPLPTVGRFHHFAGSYRQADPTHIELRIYLDGQLVKTNVLSGQLANSETSTPLYLGAARGLSDFFQGTLDDVAIYDRALSPTEIRRIYEAGPAGKCTSPAPPRIVLEPASLIVPEGSVASFIVDAEGTGPLAFQWLFNGIPLSDATNSTLTLNAVQPAQAGRYAVVVSNALGTNTSAEALLTVSPPVPCAPVTQGLVAWWSFDESGTDSIGTSHAAPQGGATFAPGMVNQGLLLNGATAFASMPDSPALDFTNALTVELWFRRDQPYVPNVQFGLFDKRDLSGRLNYGASLSVNFGLMLYYGDPASGGYQSAAHNPLPTLGEFHHFAGSYRQADETHVELNLYLDGQLVRTSLLPGRLANTVTSTPLYVGGARGLSDFFQGVIDDVSIYDRALSSAEVQEIYTAGKAGKCEPRYAPAILTQPVSRVVVEGSTTSFTVVAGGTEPLSYQWLFNGAELAGATQPTLTLDNVQLTQSGRYSVVVSNELGMVASAEATLTVTLPASVVRLVNVQAGAGGTVAVPIQLLANGEENALGFSLGFSTSLLAFLGVELAADAPPNAALVVNQDQAGSGRLGLAIALPTGTVWTRGTQELMVVRFTSAPVANPITVPLGFADQPTTRQVSDRDASVLASTFQDGTVTLLAADFEGDAAPRPNGDRSLTIVDWVQLGRFVAGLDPITGPAQFQRADCAPRSQLGNGVVGVTDWVQAGRYATGLDPLTPAGGPTGEDEPQPFQAQFAALPPDVRTVRITDVLLLSGATSNVPVKLEAQGNENAFGFSVTFDPIKLRFVGASAGGAAAGGLLNLNTARISEGRLGLALALPSGRVLPPGEQDLVVLRFGVDAAAWGTTALGFGDVPVHREMSDALAEPLAASYSGALLTLKPTSLVLQHNRSGANLLLFWPAENSQGFELESSAHLSGSPWIKVEATPIPISDQLLVTLPIISGEAAYYRLRKR